MMVKIVIVASLQNFEIIVSRQTKPLFWHRLKNLLENKKSVNSRGETSLRRTRVFIFMKKV